MSAAVFPDNTVLCNFAAVRRLDLLEGALRGRGRWTEAVAAEVTRSAVFLPDLATISIRGWLGEAIEIDDEIAVARIEHLRLDVFGGTVSSPLKHLGEAQTCYLLKEDPSWAGAWWVSDDRDALEFARRQGITTRETVDLVAGLIADRELTAGQGMELLRAMVAAGRVLRLPASASELQR
jgi:hypothetical protein